MSVPLPAVTVLFGSSGISPVLLKWLYGQITASLNAPCHSSGFSLSCWRSNLAASSCFLFCSSTLLIRSSLCFRLFPLPLSFFTVIILTWYKLFTIYKLYNIYNLLSILLLYNLFIGYLVGFCRWFGIKNLIFTKKLRDNVWQLWYNLLCNPLTFSL